MNRRRRTLAACVLAAVALSGTPVARAGLLDATIAAATATCGGTAVDPSTRSGRIRTAASYPQFMFEHDMSQLRIADDILRRENWGVTATSKQEVCDTLPYFMGQTSAFNRWVTVVDDGSGGAWVGGMFVLNDLTPTPSYLAIRFHVVDGLIQEMNEVTLTIDFRGQTDTTFGVPAQPTGLIERFFSDDSLAVGYTSLRSELGDTDEPIPGPAGVTRKAVKAYLDAFTSHDASKVPLADTARRLENMRARGTSGVEIRRQLEAPTMVAQSVQDLDLDVEGTSAFAIFKYDLDGSEAYAAMRFTVVDGLITEIEAVCAKGAHITGDPGPTRYAYCGDNTPSYSDPLVGG